MIDVDRAWARISQRPEFRNAKRSNWGFQAVSLKVAALTSAEVRSNLQAVFQNSAIVLGITAGAQINAAAATSVFRPGLDLFAAKIDYLQGRALVGTTRGVGSSIFGTGQFDIFPFQEIYMPTSGTLLYEVENLTTTTIDVWFTHHCLVPTDVG